MKDRQKTTRVVQVFLGTLLAAVMLSQATVQSFAAETTLFTDDFNNYLDRWKVVSDYQFANPSLPCKNGTIPAYWIMYWFRLAIEIDGPPCVTELSPIDLDLKHVDNYTLKFDMALPESAKMERSFAFLRQDAQNWYELSLFESTASIRKVINGKPYTLGNSTTHFPFQSSQYQVTIEVTQRQHFVVKVDEQTILSVADQAPFLPLHTPKSIAFRGLVSSTPRSITHFDNFSITTGQEAASDFSLGVLPWKQSDPEWAELEYDHAHTWAPVETMQRWGCAVTSMAMIMRYHGISQLPSGEQLTPQTLNLWLKSQPDGYFSGNLNWLAVTRLTRLISAKYGTHKLEFTRKDGQSAEMVALAKADIAANKPVIFSNGGHFFVADGISNSDNTLFVKDPAFSYQKLSQHKQPVTGIRRFQPSYTDLSYMLAIVPKDLQVEVKDEHGQVVEIERSTEYLVDEVDDVTKSPEIDQIVIAKPDTGKYTFTVSQPEEKPYTLDLYSYDLEGNVAVANKTGVVGPEPQAIEVSYKKEVALPPQPPVQKSSWKKFHKDVQLLIKLKQFSRPFVGRYIELLAKYAIKSPAGQQHFYARAIETGLKIYKPFIKSPAYQYLHKQLKSLKKQPDPVHN